MRFLLSLLLAILLGYLAWRIRGRIKLAVIVAGVTLLVTLPIRLLLAPGAFDVLDDYVVPVLALLLLWLVMWYGSTRYAERRKRPQ